VTLSILMSQPSMMVPLLLLSLLTLTLVTDVYGIKTDKQFVNTLEDNIIQRGTPLSHCQPYKVADILCSFCIDNWQSEPHQQQQNPAERRYQTIKNCTNRILDRTGASWQYMVVSLAICVFPAKPHVQHHSPGSPIN
jgi:hypothetical protein